MGSLWTIVMAAGSLALTPPPTPSGLECGESVCWESRIAGADGAGLDASAVPQVALGDVLIYTIDTVAPPDAGVFVPTNPAMGAWRIVDASTPDPATVRSDGKRLSRTELRLRALRMGAKAIPPIEVTWRLADGTSGSFETPRRLVRVRGRLENEQDPALGAAPSPVEVIATNWLLVTLATLLGGALVTLALLPLVRRLRRSGEPVVPPPPPRPANEVALETLAWLERAELEAAERYALAVDTLRAYLGARYGFDGMESTTVEFMAELAPLDIDGVATVEIQGILDDTDLVKFAKLVPSEEEARAMVHRVREIVLATWVESAEEVEQPAPQPEEGAAEAPATGEDQEGNS